LPQVDIHGQSLAAEWTSGDYFDYLRLRNGNTAVVIADVCGHGLGPALLMSSTRASLRGLSPTLDDVGELLTHGNRAVLDCVTESEFVTAFAVSYDSASRILDYAGAGHIAYLVRANGQSSMLEAQAPPLGILPDLSITTCQLPNIAVGDVLVLVTDGILESQNESQEMFGEARLLSTVSHLQNQSAATIATGLIAAAKAFAGQQVQHDDITVVIVKFL
jgi:sigma-B regulation protein RsbU (phosphoserine phosphatase)